MQVWCRVASTVKFKAAAHVASLILTGDGVGVGQSEWGACCCGWPMGACHQTNSVDAVSTEVGGEQVNRKGPCHQREAWHFRKCHDCRLNSEEWPGNCQKREAAERDKGTSSCLFHILAEWLQSERRGCHNKRGGREGGRRASAVEAAGCHVRLSRVGDWVQQCCIQGVHTQ